jgi:hypothetical protein
MLQEKVQDLFHHNPVLSLLFSQLPKSTFGHQSLPVNNPTKKGDLDRRVSDRDDFRFE